MEPNLKGAIQRNLTVEVLLHDYKNKYMFNALQDSMLKNELPIYDHKHYKEKIDLYGRYYDIGNDFLSGVHKFYPWTRFTIFDDSAVSFILTPMLHGGKGVQIFFSEE